MQTDRRKFLATTMAAVAVKKLDLQPEKGKKVEEKQLESFCTGLSRDVVIWNYAAGERRVLR